MQLISKRELFGDGYYNTGDNGFVEHWDLSKANLSFDNRVKAVSLVASVCYGNNGLNPNFKLYDKLARESIGLPSSSFEFVPVLLDEERYNFLLNAYDELDVSCLSTDFDDLALKIVRYGYVFAYDDKIYFLTNLRALMSDIDRIKACGVKDEVLDIKNHFWLNTEEECNIIKKYTRFFKVKITLRDARQLLRHRRGSVQELSRRYTTGDKIAFEFRYKLEMVKMLPNIIEEDEKRVADYFKALSMGFKAEDARDILPVSMYTTIWLGYYPDGFNNLIALRTKSSAQKAIRELTEKMIELSANT